MARMARFDPDRLAKCPPAEATFITALARRQGQDCSNDIKFAARLGVSDTLWRKTRNGQEPLGMKLWAGARDLVPYEVALAAHATLTERARTRWPAKGKAA